MRSDDEDENDYEEDEDDDEEKDLFGDDQYDGDGDGDVDVDADDGDEDEEEEDDDDGGGDDDDEDEDEDEEEDEDEDDDEGKDEDDEDAVEGSTAPAAEATPAPPKSKSASPKPSDAPLAPASQPPHLLRRALFIPGFTSPPASLSVEAIVGIPLPSAVHCLAASSCMSYLLAGSQDGYVRVYDLWASVNGGQIMTAQQRAVVGLGEGVSKAGVGRGWWSVETPVTGPEAANGTANGQPPLRKQEPVYSLACQGDGLWTLAGTQSGAINLYSLRHQPGHLVHSLTGHAAVVSALELMPGETSLLSGSWDGTVREWDLNTGQTTRTYPTSGAQISSIGMRPTNVTVTVPEATVNVNVGPDFFKADRENGGADSVKEEQKDGDGDAKMADADGEADADADGEADDGASLGSLFDDDAEGEDEGDVTMTEPTPAPSLAVPTPAPAPAPAPAPLLALPGTSKPTPPTPTVSTPTKPAKTFPTPAVIPPKPAPSGGMPILSPTEFRGMSNDVLLTASMNGQVTLVDRRVGGAIGRLQPGEKAPPWCMSATWLGDGNQVLAGRRNGTIDVWDTRMASQHAPGLLRTLRTPLDSGPISCVVAFPDGRHVASASTDNIRLWNTADYYDPVLAEKLSNRSRPPFRIIAGHHGGTISSMIVDPTCRFLVSASGDRGWQGEATKVVLVHEVKW